MNRKLVSIIAYITAVCFFVAGLLNFYDLRKGLGTLMMICALLQLANGFINMKKYSKEKKAENKKD